MEEQTISANVLVANRAGNKDWGHAVLDDKGCCLLIVLEDAAQVKGLATNGTRGQRTGTKTGPEFIVGDNFFAGKRPFAQAVYAKGVPTATQ
jgi:hypothetical protein